MSSKKLKGKSVPPTVSRSLQDIHNALQEIINTDKPATTSEGQLTCPVNDCSHHFSCKLIGKKNVKDMASHIFIYHIKPLIEKYNSNEDMCNDESRINAFNISLENYCLVCMKKTCKTQEKQNQLKILAVALYTTFFCVTEQVDDTLVDEVDDESSSTIPHPPTTPTPSKSRNNQTDNATVGPAVAAGETPLKETSNKTTATASKPKGRTRKAIEAASASAKKTSPEDDEDKVRALILDPTKDDHLITVERQRVNLGIMELERVKSMFKLNDFELGEASNKVLTSYMQDIEEFLNKGKMTREEVTSKGDDVFDFIRCVNEEGDRQGGLDLYTGWSKEEFLTVMDVMYGAKDNESNGGETDPNHGLVGEAGGKVIALNAASINPEHQHWFRKKDNRLFYEVDHIWEVQIIHIAIRELMRFRAAKKKSGTISTNAEDTSINNFLYRYQLGLVELHYITKLVNSLSNLNCTPWNINLYKGKLMKQFRSTYQINENALNYDLRSCVIGNRNYTFMMKIFPSYQQIWKVNSPVGNNISKSSEVVSSSNVGTNGINGSEDMDTNALAASKYTIFQNIQNAMRNVLTSLFYNQFYALDTNAATLKDIGMEGGEDIQTMNKMMLNRDVLKLLYGILCHIYQTMFPDG